jgi:protein translocase, SecG subunit
VISALNTMNGGFYKVYNVIEVGLIIVSVLIIIAVLMQPSKQQDALNALSGGGGDLFTKQKKRGFEAVMVKVTYVLLVLFFVFSLVLVYLSSH